MNGKNINPFRIYYFINYSIITFDYFSNILSPNFLNKLTRERLRF